jgi:hypothetical protein
MNQNQALTSTTTTYLWKPGSHRGGLDPQVVGEALEVLIGNGDGLLHPQEIVEAAKPATSPLHPAFEWDDRAAGQAYRIIQARAMVQHLEVEIITKDGEVREGVRAFVNITRHDGEQGYVRTLWAASDKDMMRGLLGKALDELNSWRRRYGDFVELARLNDVIDEHVAALELKRLEDPKPD